MKKIHVLVLLIFVVFSTGGCSFIEDIFEAGFWAGIIAAIVAILVIFLIVRLIKAIANK